MLLFLLCLSSNVFAQVQAITESTDGTIWFGNEERLLKLSGTTAEVATGYTPNGRVNTLVGDSTGIWVGTDQILVRCKDNACENYSGIPAAPVMALATGKNQTLWVLTNDKLYNIQGKTVTSTAIPSTQLESLAVGFDDSVFMGTRSAVKKYSKGKFEDVLPDFAQAIAVDQKGAVWLGTGHEVNKLQGGTMETFHLPPPPANVRMRPPITSILPTKSEKLYVGTQLGLFRLSGKEFKKISDDAVLALLEDSKGTIWVGTSDGIKRMTAGKTSDVALPR